MAKPHSRVHRPVAALLALAVLSVSGWVWTQYIEWFGFPDGFKSELGVAENEMAIWFCWLSVAIALALFGLVWRSFAAPIGRWLLVLTALYLVVAVGCLVLDRYDQSYMMSDVGG